MLQKNTGHLSGTGGFAVIGGNVIDSKINVGLLKNSEWSGSREAVRQKCQHAILSSETTGSVSDPSLLFAPSHNQYKVSLCSIISFADLSATIMNRKVELWMWSISEDLLTVENLFWGLTRILKTEGKKEREKRNICASVGKSYMARSAELSKSNSRGVGRCRYTLVGSHCRWSQYIN